MQWLSDFRDLNARMVDRLVERGYVRTPRVEEAFRAVYRHPFLPDVSLEKIYSGEAIVTKFGPDGLPISSSSEPAIMAVMVEQLQPQRGDRILEIGTGTGYNAVILAYLAGPEGVVITVDIDADIVQTARENLTRAGFGTVRVVCADGWLGAPEQAPYDRIEVTVGVWDLSPHWVDQLREGGILVAPLWLRSGVQASIAFKKEGQRLRSGSVEPCGFMRLRGPHAGPETYVRLDGWTASVEEARPEEIDSLKNLLGTTPRSEPAPALSPGWYIRLALDEPGAVTFSHRDDWRRGMAGIFDAAHHSLAVVEGYIEKGPERVLAFGGDSALVRLREKLAKPQSIDLRTLQVEAVPSSRTADGQKAWVFERPSYQFVIRERG